MIGDNKIRQVIDIAWQSYIFKVSSGLLNPENEKMMQLQLAQMFQTIFPIFEYHSKESIKVSLECPILIEREPNRRVIDLLITHTEGDTEYYYPIELKCFREFTRDGSGKKRGAQNLGMFDYWCDIENIEQYTKKLNYLFATQLTLTDDIYYVYGKHKGTQTAIYSTNIWQKEIGGTLSTKIANRSGLIELENKYSMAHWQMKGSFYFIRQECKSAEKYIDSPNRKVSNISSQLS